MHFPAIAGLAVSLMASPAAHGAAQPPIPALNATPVSVPLQNAGWFGPSAMSGELYLPAGAGPFPVVIFAHGRPPTAAERRSIKLTGALALADYFTAKGFAVVLPMRPGYGRTGGIDQENPGTTVLHGKCRVATSMANAPESAAEMLESAVSWVRRQPFARKDQILVVGQSEGGLAALTLGAENPEGVVAIINFSGGEAGYPQSRPGASCGVNELKEIFASAGRSIHLPSLWIYAPDDENWGPEAPKQWFAAFAKGGSNATFAATPPIGNGGGHNLLHKAPQDWQPIVDSFIAGLGLK